MIDDNYPLRAVAIAVLALAVIGCGGGGGDDVDANAAPGATTPTPVTTSGFDGTAYLKTTRTALRDGRTTGIARDAAQGLVDQCNLFRSAYYEGLFPVLPTETTMASLDVRVDERWFDRDRARTDVFGPALTLPDMQRWLAQLEAAAGQTPAVPPDCTGTLVEIRQTTIWRDGLTYLVRYQIGKAFGSKSPTNTPTPYVRTDNFNSFPFDQYLGQTCRQVSGVTELAPDSKACIWDLFPYVAYLNWPFALSGRVQFGPVPGIHETIVPVEARSGHAIDPAVFEMPRGIVAEVN